MEYSAVIVAAGRGERMKLGFNKVYARLDNKETILAKAMRVFLDDDDCAKIVVVTDKTAFQKEITVACPARVTIVKGGDTRQASVINGLREITTDTVMIHDGARPFVKKSEVEALKEAMNNYDGAILAAPAKETVKIVRDGFIEKTVPRDTVMLAQTPQAFKTGLLRSCLEQAYKDDYTGTDDAQVVEKYADVKIKVVEGSYHNRKITTPEDL